MFLWWSQVCEGITGDVSGDGVEDDNGEDGPDVLGFEEDGGDFYIKEVVQALRGKGIEDKGQTQEHEGVEGQGGFEIAVEKTVQGTQGTAAGAIQAGEFVERTRGKQPHL